MGARIRFLENSLVILPRLMIHRVAGNPTGGKVKVKLAGISTNSALTVPDTTSSGLAALDMVSIPI